MKNLGVCIVFGGTGGIGLEAAKELEIKGHQCVLVSRGDNNEISSLNFPYYKCDVREHMQIENVINEIRKKQGEISSIVYSISPNIDNTYFADSEWDLYQLHIDSQVKGFYNVVKSLVKLNQKNRLKIICVLTEYCHGKPPKMLAHYVSAKYGLMGLCKSLAIELADKGLTINTVSPGIVQTKLTSELPPKLIEITAHTNPMKRIATTKDVAGAIVYLCSDEADYLNGVDILINGGAVMK